MLFLDGVYVERPDGGTRFRWVKAPTTAELTHLTHTIARRVGRFLERQGLLVCDAEQSYLSGEAIEAGPMDQLFGHSITYRIAVGPQAGRKVFTLQTLPADDDPFTALLCFVVGSRFDKLDCKAYTYKCVYVLMKQNSRGYKFRVADRSRGPVWVRLVLLFFRYNTAAHRDDILVRPLEAR